MEMISTPIESLWDLPPATIRPRTNWSLLNRWGVPSCPINSATSSASPLLRGTFEFLVTLKHRLVIFREDGDVEVQEYYHGPPQSPHPLRVPISAYLLHRIPTKLWNDLTGHLADLGVDTVSRQDIADIIMPLVYEAVEGKMSELYVAVDLEITIVDLGGESEPISTQSRPGASPATIRRLEEASFSAAVTKGLQGDCAICLEDMSGGGESNNRKLSKLPCGHIFHCSCVVRWLETNMTCPLCRRELDD